MKKKHKFKIYYGSVWVDWDKVYEDAKKVFCEKHGYKYPLRHTNGEK